MEFSALEERVIDIAGLTAAVEGVNESIAFGAPIPPADENNSAAANCLNEELGDDPNTDEEVPVERGQRKRRAPSSLSLLDTQVRQQKQFHGDILRVLQGQAKKVSDLAYYGKQISKRLMDIHTLEEEKLKEKRRHNLEMEKLAYERLKIKKQMLTLQLDNL